MARRRYSDEYKGEAVAMTRLPGTTLQQVATELGINLNILGRWRKAIEKHGEDSFPGQGHAWDEEVVRLKRELARVRKERDFLKEAAAFFAKASK
jgi:transposase